MAPAREHVQGEKRSGRGLDGFSVFMVSERRISPQRRGWPESDGKKSGELWQHTVHCIECC